MFGTPTSGRCLSQYPTGATSTDQQWQDRARPATSRPLIRLPPVTEARAPALLALALSLAACGGEEPEEPPAPTVPPPSPAPAPPPPPDPPGIPIVRLTAEGSDYVEWEWDPVEGATRYVVDLAEGRTLENRREDTTENPCYRMVGLDPDQPVVIWVRAIRETAAGSAAGDWSHRVWGVTSIPASEMEPRTCTDERVHAERFSGFVREWDGTPFRVDVVDTFPDRVSRAAVVEHLLDAVALAD